MAVAAQNSVASLMRKTLDRQAAVTQMKLKFKNTQIENVLVNYVRDGTVGPYNEVIRVIRDYTLNDDNFRVLLEDSMSCVVLLGKDLKQFVDVLLNVQWLYRDEELVALYSRFLLSLVTAHTYHCSKVMTSLVKLFKENGENWDVNPPDETIRLWSNIHSSIAQIVAVMPMTSNLLMQCLVEQFPYYSVGCFLNRAYIRNLIWISKYIPSLREQIMAVIVKNMVEMDVNMVEKYKNKSQNDDSVSAMEVDSEKHDGISVTLDYCMMEMLEWLEDERDPVLRTMCNIFERMILPTHGIKSVQFLILYTISISQQCADRVLNGLWVVASGIHGLGPGALATRRTAASHLAGLLARAVRVPNTRLVHYLRCMADWCHSYITATQETSGSDSAKVHGAFHAICHAIFYLVAFKHQHLFASKENINFLESLNLPRLVTSVLNPLRSCPPQVQRAFAAVTRAHQLVYCQAIIERNARHTLQSDAEVTYDEWYPYDPYVLPVSGKTIWPLCIEYKDWQQDGDDETQYTSMKRKLEPEDDDYLMPPAQRFAHSLSNCISPGFKNSESLVV